MVDSWLVGECMKVKLSDIQVAHLNAQSVIVLTQFVRLARVREGADLRLQHPKIVKAVFEYAKRTDNPDLIVLFMRFKRQLKLFLYDHKDDESFPVKLVATDHC